jgi:hypothetical protein
MLTFGKVARHFPQLEEFSMYHQRLTERIIDLARRTVITDADWLVLLQERADALKPVLHQMTLRQLDEVQFMNDYFHEHGLRKDKPQLISTDERFSIEMRGIFPKDRSWASVSSTTYERPPQGGRATAATHRFWGLSRNGEWVAIEAYVTHSEEPYKDPGRTEHVERAKTVSIAECSLADLCEFSSRHPRLIWDRLGEVADDWVKHRQSLLADAERIQELFEHEAAILRIIARK